MVTFYKIWTIRPKRYGAALIPTWHLQNSAI
jgi:hypothetical protein